MHATMAEALAALSSMKKGHPYSLDPEDPKRRLADDLARIADELGIRPLVIGGLAVNHHGYLRLTADVDVLVSKSAALKLVRRLRSEPGWRRYAEGFKNSLLGVSVDICVEAERTAPRSAETFPDPAELDSLNAGPLPVPSLPDLIALKVMSARARDDADVVELLKRHRSRIASVRRAAARRLRSAESRQRLSALADRAREELKRRRS